MRSLLWSTVLVVATVGACSSSSTTTGGADGGATTDAGTSVDGATADGGALADAATCPTYDGANKACTTAADCAAIALGCYCGAQPIIGVSASIAAQATACEKDKAAHCALGCPNMPGGLAEDGNNNADGGTIKVLCDQSKCHTVLQ